MTLRRKPTRPATFALAVMLCGSAAAAEEPTLKAWANAARARSETWVAPVRLVDTEWWITVDGEQGSEPLSVIEYQARFTDPEGQDQRAMVGTIELGAASRHRVKGRIELDVPMRTDYQRPVRVRLRLRDAGDNAGEWVDVLFPVRANIAAAGETPAAVAAVPPPPGETRESLGQVETEVNDDASMADVRRALLVQARVRGATDVENLRMVSSDGKRSRFAADAVRILRADASPTPPPAPAPEVTPVRERVLGTITMRHGRH